MTSHFLLTFIFIFSISFAFAHEKNDPKVCTIEYWGPKGGQQFHLRKGDGADFRGSDPSHFAIIKSVMAKNAPRLVDYYKRHNTHKKKGKTFDCLLPLSYDIYTHYRYDLGAMNETRNNSTIMSMDNFIRKQKHIFDHLNRLTSREEAPWFAKDYWELAKEQKELLLKILAKHNTDLELEFKQFMRVNIVLSSLGPDLRELVAKFPELGPITKLLGIDDLNEALFPLQEHYVSISTMKEMNLERQIMSAQCRQVRRSSGMKAKFHEEVMPDGFWHDLKSYVSVLHMPTPPDFTAEGVEENGYVFQYCFFKERESRQRSKNTVAYYFPGLTSGPESFFEIKAFRQIRNEYRRVQAKQPVWVGVAFGSLSSLVEAGQYEIFSQEVIPYLEGKLSKGKNGKQGMNIKHRFAMGASLGGGNVVQHAMKNPQFYDKAVVLGGSLLDFNIFDDEAIQNYVEDSGAKPAWVKLAVGVARKRIQDEELWLNENPFTLWRNMLTDEKEQMKTRFYFSVGERDELGFQLGMWNFCQELNAEKVSCQFDEVTSFEHERNPATDPWYMKVLLRESGHLVINPYNIFNFLYRHARD